MSYTTTGEGVFGESVCTETYDAYDINFDPKEIAGLYIRG